MFVVTQSAERTLWWFNVGEGVYCLIFAMGVLPSLAHSRGELSSLGAMRVVIICWPSGVIVFAVGWEGSRAIRRVNRLER